MQMLTGKQQQNMRNASGIISPTQNPITKIWISLLNVIVRVLTLGRAHVVVSDYRAPIRWNGVIR